MLWIVKKPNEKLQRYAIIFLWEVIYVHFHNWDRPLDLVLVVYDLIELIIEASLWIKDYSTFDTHTQHTRLLFIECLFHLYDCTCSNVMCILNCLSIKPKKIFEYFVCFWKCFWKSFYAFVFFFFVFFFFWFFFFFFCDVHQKLFQRHFQKKLATKHFPRKWVKAKYENTYFKQKLLQLSCDYFMSKVYPQKVLCFGGIFRK